MNCGQNSGLFFICPFQNHVQWFVKQVIPSLKSCLSPGCLHSGGESQPTNQSVSELSFGAGATGWDVVEKVCVAGTVSGSGVKGGLTKKSSHAFPRS